MTIPPPYPEFDEVMKALLADIAPVVTFVEDLMPEEYIIVTRIGGNDDGISDSPLIDTEYVSTTRDGSKQLKTAGQDRIRYAGNTAPGGYLIDIAEEKTGGIYTPPVQRQRRSVAAVNRLSYRRPRTA